MPNNPFYDSKRDEFERRRKKYKPLLKRIDSKEKITTPIIDKKSDKYKKSKLNKPLKNSKWAKPLINKKSDTFKKSKWTQPLLKKKLKKYEGTIWTEPLIKKRYKHEKYSEEKQKQIRRLRRFIKSAQERGYEFDDNIIDLAMTAEELKKITPNDLYKKASFLDSLSGEIFSGEEGRRLENYRRTKKARETLKQHQAELEINIDEDNEAFDDISDNYLDDDLVNSDVAHYDTEYEREQRKAEYNPDTNINENKQFEYTNPESMYSADFDYIIASIEAIPDKIYYGYDKAVNLEFLKNKLYSLWANIYSEFAQKENGLQELYEYITAERVVERFNRLSTTLGDSNWSPVINSLEELATIFNAGRPLDAETAQQFEIMNDYYDYGY